MHDFSSPPGAPVATTYALPVQLGLDRAGTVLGDDRPFWCTLGLTPLMEAGEAPVRASLESPSGTYGDMFLRGVFINDVRLDAGTQIPQRLQFTDYCALASRVVIPAETRPSVVGTQRRMRDILRWTQWSDRIAARALCTTHPTIARMQRMGSTPRSTEVAGRVAKLHEVLERLWNLTHDASRLSSALLSPSQTGETCVDLFAAERFTTAYRVAVNALSGRTNQAMLQPRRDVVAKAATVPLDGQSLDGG